MNIGLDSSSSSASLFSQSTQTYLHPHRPSAVDFQTVKICGKRVELPLQGPSYLSLDVLQQWQAVLWRGTTCHTGRASVTLYLHFERVPILGHIEQIKKFRCQTLRHYFENILQMGLFEFRGSRD